MPENFSPEMKDVVFYNLNLPVKSKCSAVITANTAEVGLLHILLRHPTLLKANVPTLPPAMAQLTKEIRRSDATKKSQSSFDKLLSKEKDEIFKSKRKILFNA